MDGKSPHTNRVRRRAPHRSGHAIALIPELHQDLPTLDTLARGEVTVGDLAARFPISLNGVSKHVRVLERAGLVARDVQGREHRLTFDARRLEEAAWMARYRVFWESRLDALEGLLRTRKRSRSRTR